MLRAFVLVLGLVAFCAGALLCLWARPAGIQLMVFGGIWTLGILFERWRYRTRTAVGGRWVLTDERFEEPDTGRVMAVYFNEDTGERRYEPQAAGSGAQA